MKAWVFVRNFNVARGHEVEIRLLLEKSEFEANVQIWDDTQLIAVIYQEDMDKLAKRWLAMREKARNLKRKKAGDEKKSMS